MTAPGTTADGYGFDRDAAPVVVPAAGFSVGAYLAKQRDLRGISLDDLATLTRIPRRSLARLESGAFDRQHDAFARGFVRTVALAIGIDPGDTLVRMLAATATETEARSAPLLRRAGAVVAATALLLSVAVLAFWRTDRIGLPSARSLLLRPDAPRIVGRDYVREFAEEVRNQPLPPAADAVEVH